MTATHPVYGSKDRTILWGILLSVLLHGVLLVPGVRDMFEALDIELREEVVTVPMEFELVSPPQNPTPSNNVSRYLSTVSSQASDVVDTPDKTDVPHGEGEIPKPDHASTNEGAEGTGTSELPPLPNETVSLREALERSKFITQSSPRRDQALPEENPDFKNDGSARASIGGISINTTAWDFAPYLLDLKHRIKQHWIPPLAFTALGAISGYTWVTFRINPDGTMEALGVAEEEGHESLHRSSVNAIRGAAPFRPLPKDFPEEYLEIKFGFYYLLPGDAEKFFNDENHRKEQP